MQVFIQIRHFHSERLETFCLKSVAKKTFKKSMNYFITRGFTQNHSEEKQTYRCNPTLKVTTKKSKNVLLRNRQYHSICYGYHSAPDFHTVQNLLFHGAYDANAFRDFVAIILFCHAKTNIWAGEHVFCITKSTKKKCFTNIHTRKVLNVD